MIFQKNVILRDGSSCLIRSLDGKDGEETLRIFNLTHGQTENLLTYPEETTFTPEQEAEYLQGLADSDNGVELGAFVDGVLAGTAGINPVSNKIKMKHRAEFGIALDQAYWGRGIGRALTEACIACAKQAGYIQLELDVVADNESALNLYQNVGFIEYGRNPKAFRTRSGAWQEMVLMRLEL